MRSGVAVLDASVASKPFESSIATEVLQGELLLCVHGFFGRRSVLDYLAG